MIHVANPSFRETEINAVTAVLEDGMVADGPEVRRFESEFADYCGANYGVATANGTVALHAALEALDIGRGDTVVTTPFSFVASANAIRLAGATPVFADIDPETFALDPDAAKRAVRTSDADAILAVHLYGLPADMDALSDVAADEDVFLVEDAAQAHGAKIRDQRVGSFGDAAAFSFYPTKNMTTGEGGMVLTDRQEVADRVASYCNHGRSTDETYAHERVGTNYRLTSIAAAIGRAQLERLPENVRSRRSNARRLTEALQDVPDIEPPVEPEGFYHAYNQYTVRTQNRAHLKQHLEEAGVGSAIYYPTPIHRLKAYDGFDAEVPEAERAAQTVLSIPVHPELDEDDVDHVIDVLKNVEVRPIE